MPLRASLDEGPEQTATGRKGIDMNHRIIVLGTAAVSCFTFGGPVLAQGPCSGPPPSSENLLAIWNLHQAGAYALPNDTGWTYGVPVTFHVSHEVGIPPPMDQSDLDLMVKDLNDVVQGADLEFFQQGAADLVEDNEAYLITCTAEFEAFTNANRVSGTLNAYLTSYWTLGVGCSALPPDNCVCGQSAFSVVDPEDQFMILRYRCLLPQDPSGTNVTWMHRQGTTSTSSTRSSRRWESSVPTAPTATPVETSSATHRPIHCREP
jgi:hypothetical protein